MTTIEDARKRLASRRQALQRARASIPSPTQRTLRGGGLDARQRRRKNSAILDEISRREQALNQTEVELNKFETKKKEFDIARAEQEALIKSQQRRADILNRYVKGKPLNREEQLQLQKEFDKTQGLQDSIAEIKKRQDVGEIAPYLSSLPTAKLDELRKYGVKYELEEIAPSPIETPPSQSVIKFEDKKDGDNVNVSLGSSGGIYDKIRRGFSNFIGDSSDRKEGREVFIKDLKGFASAKPEDQFGTSIIRPPTLEESFKIKKAEYWGSIAGLQEGSKIIEAKLFGERPKVRKVSQEEFDALKSSGQITTKGGGLTMPFFAEKPFDLASEGLLRAGEFVEKKDAFKDLKSDFPVLSTEISRKEGKKVISDVLKIATYSGLMSTGATQQSQYTEVINAQGQRVFIKKSDLRDYLLKLQRKGKVVSTPTKAEKFRRARELLSKATTSQEKAEVLKIIQSAYGKSFTADLMAQEGIILGKTGIASGGTALGGSQTSAVSVVVEVPPIPQLKNVGKTITAVSLLDVSAVGQLPKLKTDQLFDWDIKTDTKQKQKTRVISGFKTASGQDFDSAQKSGQDTKTNTALLSGLALGFGFGSGQDTRGGRGQTRPPRTELRPPRRPPRRIPKPIPFPDLLGLEKTARPKKARGKIQGYYPMVKDKGKWIKVSQKPLNKADSLGLAGHIVDNTTSSQLRLKKTKEKVKKILNRRIQERKFRDYQIRNGRRVPLKNSGRIERRANRIDTFGEKKGLRVAKYMKSQQFKSFKKTSLFGRPQKKTRKKVKFL